MKILQATLPSSGKDMNLPLKRKGTLSNTRSCKSPQCLEWPIPKKGVEEEEEEEEMIKVFSHYKLEKTPIQASLISSSPLAIEERNQNSKFKNQRKAPFCSFILNHFPYFPWPSILLVSATQTQTPDHTNTPLTQDLMKPP